MELTLSAGALPGAPLSELRSACARRGIAAVELVDDGDRGWALADSDGGWTLADADARAGGDASGAVRIGALRASSAATALSDRAATLSGAWRIPVSVSADAVSDSELADAARRFARAGGVLLLAHGGDPAEAARVRARIETADAGRQTLGLAWEVRPAADVPVGAREVLAAAGPRLRMVRLHGGGPEAAGQTGGGVGALMAQLTLARFRGPLVLTPSTSAYLMAWAHWLGRRGGWGCGSKGSAPERVALGAPGSAAWDGVDRQDCIDSTGTERHEGR